MLTNQDSIATSLPLKVLTSPGPVSACLGTSKKYSFVLDSTYYLSFDSDFGEVSALLLLPAPQAWLPSTEGHTTITFVSCICSDAEGINALPGLWRANVSTDQNCSSCGLGLLPNDFPQPRREMIRGRRRTELSSSLAPLSPLQDKQQSRTVTVLKAVLQVPPCKGQFLGGIVLLWSRMIFMPSKRAVAKYLSEQIFPPSSITPRSCYFLPWLTIKRVRTSRQGPALSAVHKASCILSFHLIFAFPFWTVQLKIQEKKLTNSVC